MNPFSIRTLNMLHGTNRPSTIQFYPTLRCNRECSFCFNRNLQLTDDVVVSDFRKITSLLGKLEVPYLDILGGEPTLHPQLMRLVDMINSNGLKTTVSTKGSNVPVLGCPAISYIFHKDLHVPDPRCVQIDAENEEKVMVS